MGVLIPLPLPECAMCERPTRRDIHTENGGLCTECLAGVIQASHMLPPRRPR